ncbi:unnamed protein product, partial [Sphenostylis stenocarpa]
SGFRFHKSCSHVSAWLDLRHVTLKSVGEIGGSNPQFVRFVVVYEKRCTEELNGMARVH